MLWAWWAISPGFTSGSSLAMPSRPRQGMRKKASAPWMAVPRIASEVEAFILAEGNEWMCEEDVRSQGE